MFLYCIHFSHQKTHWSSYICNCTLYISQYTTHSPIFFLSLSLSLSVCLFVCLSVYVSTVIIYLLTVVSMYIYIYVYICIILNVYIIFTSMPPDLYWWPGWGGGDDAMDGSAHGRTGEVPGGLLDGSLERRCCSCCSCCTVVVVYLWLFFLFSLLPSLIVVKIVVIVVVLFSCPW